MYIYVCVCCYICVYNNTMHPACVYRFLFSAFLSW